MTRLEEEEEQDTFNLLLRGVKECYRPTDTGIRPAEILGVSGDVLVSQFRSELW